MIIEHASTPVPAVETTVRRLANILGCAAVVLVPPVLRIALALPFFRSGLTRWDGFLSLSPAAAYRSDEHTSELQSLMRISYAVFCLTTKLPTIFTVQFHI